MEQQERFTVTNVKCDGCATSIRDGLLKESGIREVDVDVPTSTVTVTGTGLSREHLAGRLTALGYPEA